MSSTPERPPTLVWFRADLRLADNPALTRAAELGAPVVAAFVLDEAAPGCWRPGGAARWWLHDSLAALAKALAELGVPLILRRGPAAEAIPALADETGAGAVLWNRHYAPWSLARDTGIKADLKARGLRVESFNGRLLVEPWTPTTGNGEPYKVFTPYWKALQALGEPPEPLPAPARLPAGPAPASDSLDDWGLQPTAPDWAGGLRATWTPGEPGAQARLAHFLDDTLSSYPDHRDRPGRSGTSGLSPHLAWGEVSPRQVWHAARHREAADGTEAAGLAFRRQLAWREFSHHLLHAWPDLPEATWKSEFRAFPWRADHEAYRAWTRGATGYPLVDAGLRALWHNGWLHNRVRMVVGSFLVKDLLLPWQWGEAWFWDTLVDADLANNAASWQWIAGCGADAAPYFRIFNPVTQSRKCDPDGSYVRRWVPELAALPDTYLHAPWTAPREALLAAEVRLDETYPTPIVGHDAARKRALAAFETVKAAKAAGS